MRQPVSHYAESHYPSGHYDEGRYDEGQEDYGLVGEERAEDYPRRDRRLPAILLTLMVMALFAGGLWFAYVQGTKHAPVATAQRDGLPLLRADERPTKVKPDQPGGLQIPGQNVSLYNDKPGGGPVEKLLPQPEQPMARPAPAPEPVVPAPAAASPPPTPAAPAGSPADVATAAPPAAKPATAAAEPASPGAPAKTTAPAAAEPGAATGKIQVRLASVRSPDAAREEWSRLKQGNADLLGKLSGVAVRTDLGDKGIYYRVQAGPLADAAAAERLCAELKRRNHGCILAR